MLKGKPYLILICVTAGLGGFLFGFDTAVISGAVSFLRTQFDLNPAMEGWVMSSALIGCLAGAAVAGYLADKYGRKKVLFASAILFIISALGCMVAFTAYWLVAARIVGGIGVGFAAMVAPIFIAELAPSNLRGRFVSLYQLAITLGILCSYLSNSFLLKFSSGHFFEIGSSLHLLLEAQVWRAMLGSNAVPAVFFLLCLLFIPESPRWLVNARRNNKAFAILNRINGADIACAELNEIENTIITEEKSLKQLLEPKFRIALLIGLLLPFFCQLSGITTVMYYAPSILEKAGFKSGSAMQGASVIGFFNMIFTLIALWKIDKWGRKPLLIWGFTGLGVVLIVIGLLFTFHGAIDLLLGAFIFYIAIFAATLGPGVWVLLSEIYPTRVRGRAMSLGTLSLFLGSAFITQTYPILRESSGIGTAFFAYGVCILPVGYFIKKLIPETKGKSLEDIETCWNGSIQNEEEVALHN